MKINFKKTYGGVLVPFSDMDAERMNRFKTGEVYPVDIKQSRNQEFHGKVMAFLHHCFKYWCRKKQLPN